MFDIPEAPLLDKQKLVGGCVRLRPTIEAARLLAEVGGLPPSVWGTTGGRVGVHDAAEAVFLRGFAPAEGDLPVEDRPVLDGLPYARFIIENMIPAQPQRCLLARLPPATTIAPHIDRALYFAKTLRVHVPVETNASVFMVAGTLCYRMQPGEIWVLNNSSRHAAWNAHPVLSRTHMICDFLPSPALLELLDAGERNLGEHMPHVEQHLADPRPVGVSTG